MGWVDIDITENFFFPGFMRLLHDHDWESDHFYRVAYTEDMMCCVAEHYLFKSPTGDYFGVARVSDEWKIDTTENLILDSTNRISSDRRLPKFYIYTLERWNSLKDERGNTKFHSVKVNSSPTVGALDLETFDKYYPNSNQSPIVPIQLRPIHPTEVFFGPLKDRRYSNWFGDSKIHVKGFIDEKSLFLIIQADTTPSFSGNDVPAVPIFFGRMDVFGSKTSYATAMFGGSSSQGGTIMPIHKPYWPNPGNGLMDIIVNKTKYGEYYQSHYLSWNTPSISFQGSSFNPSRYDNHIHASLAYVFHPEHGIHGTLPNIILTNQLSILGEDIMEVEKQHCPEEFVTYVCQDVSGFSPLTKLGTTPYIPLTLGIRNK